MEMICIFEGGFDVVDRTWSDGHIRGCRSDSVESG